jgi:hypothetical protein
VKDGVDNLNEGGQVMGERDDENPGAVKNLRNE